MYTLEKVESGQIFCVKNIERTVWAQLQKLMWKLLTVDKVGKNQKEDIGDRTEVLTKDWR